MTRVTLYVLLPLSIVLALVFVALGVPQTLAGSVDATTLEGAKQTISIGPMASQEAIKELGTNGGGFMNANSAHPFENPNAWTNIIADLGAAADPGRLGPRLRPRRRRHAGRAARSCRRWRFCSSSASASSTGRRAREPGRDRARRRSVGRQSRRQGDPLRPGARRAVHARRPPAPAPAPSSRCTIR